MSPLVSQLPHGSGHEGDKKHPTPTYFLLKEYKKAKFVIMKKLFLILSTLYFCGPLVVAEKNHRETFLCKVTKGSHTFYIYAPFCFHPKPYQVPPTIIKLLQASDIQLIFEYDFEEPTYVFSQKARLKKLERFCNDTEKLFPHVKKLYQYISKLPASSQNFVPYFATHIIAAFLSQEKKICFPHEELYMLAKKHRVKIQGLGRWYDDTNLDTQELISHGEVGVNAFCWMTLPDQLPMKLYTYTGKRKMKEWIANIERFVKEYETGDVHTFLTTESDNENMINLYKNIVKKRLQEEGTLVFVVSPWLVFGEYGLFNQLEYRGYQLEFLPHT